MRALSFDESFASRATSLFLASSPKSLFHDYFKVLRSNFPFRERATNRVARSRSLNHQSYYWQEPWHGRFRCLSLAVILHYDCWVHQVGLWDPTRCRHWLQLILTVFHQFWLANHAALFQDEQSRTCACRLAPRTFRYRPSGLRAHREAFGSLHLSLWLHAPKVSNHLNSSSPARASSAHFKFPILRCVWASLRRLTRRCSHGKWYLSWLLAQKSLHFLPQKWSR